MAVSGTLNTVALPDLLQWISNARKSGGLQVERKKVSKRFYFRQGAIIACSSDDPPNLLGQYLLARGLMTEQVLQEALMRQVRTGENLGVILVKVNALSNEELLRYLAAKAEETVMSLFDWQDAYFRFDEEMGLDSDIVRVNLSVEEVLLRGAQRRDEMDRIRLVFPSPDLILLRTDREVHEETLSNPMARRLYEAIDGERSLSAILLHSYGADFLAYRFLNELHKTGRVEILSKPEPTRESPESASANELAKYFMSRGEFEAALDTLNPVYEENPGDNAIRELIKNAEQAFLDEIETEMLPPSGMLEMTCADEGLITQDLSSEDFFLISRIKEESLSVQSLLWVAPMRRVEVMRSLKRFLDKGLIGIRPADDSEAKITASRLHSAESPEPADAPAVVTLADIADPEETGPVLSDSLESPFGSPVNEERGDSQQDEPSVAIPVIEERRRSRRHAMPATVSVIEEPAADPLVVRSNEEPAAEPSAAAPLAASIGEIPASAGSQPDPADDFADLDRVFSQGRIEKPAGPAPKATPPDSKRD